MEETNSETSNSKQALAIVCLDASTASFFVSETNVALSFSTLVSQMTNSGFRLLNALAYSGSLSTIEIGVPESPKCEADERKNAQNELRTSIVTRLGPRSGYYPTLEQHKEPDFQDDHSEKK